MIRSIAIAAALGILSNTAIAGAETSEAKPPQQVTVTAPESDKSAAPAQAEKKIRIGYADMAKLAGQSDAGKVAKAHFEAKADRHKAQIETKQKLLEKEKTTLEAKLSSYTPEQRAAKIKAYEKKVDELKKLLQKADKEMKPMQEELFRELYEKIEKAAHEYGESNGFTAIIDKKELLYLGKGVDAEDVTGQILEVLNRK